MPCVNASGDPFGASPGVIVELLTQDPCLTVERNAKQASGKNTGRPELDACLKALRKCDTLAVWRLDRFGRSLGDLAAARGNKHF
jgi:Resolvase, N terminal domain